MENIIW